MKVVLAIGGGIAAYKSAELARSFVKRGDEVQAVLTRAAQEFITPLTFATLTGRKVITDLFSSASPEATLSSAVEHIGVAKENDVLVVAPATANILSKFCTWSGGRFFVHALFGVYRARCAGASHERRYVEASGDAGESGSAP